MPNQIEIDVRADTSQARQAVEQLTQDVERLKARMPAAGTPGSGLLTPLPPGLGGPGTQTPLLDAATEAAKRNAGALREMTGATNEWSESTRRGGINFEAMIERMVVRLAIFEAVRLAIKGVMAAISEFSNLQQAKIQFDALSIGADHLAARFDALKQSADKAVMPIDQAVKLRATLLDLGATEDETVWLTRELGQWSHVLGIEADRLAESLGRVAKGEGSLQDMRLVTRMMGEQREAGLQLVQTYENLQRAQKNLEAENKAVSESMNAIVRSAEHMSEQAERRRTRGEEFLKQTGLTPGIEAQLPRLAQMPAGISVDYLRATGLLRLPQMPLGTSQIVLNQIQDYIAQYRAGLAAIQTQEGISPQAMRTLGPTLPTEYVMRAAKESREDQLRNMREQAQGDQMQREFMQTQAGLATSAAKTQIQTALPQAVGAPPPSVWNAWKDSIQGQTAQLKQSIDSGMQNVVKAVSDLANGTNATATNTENLYTLLSSGT